jgi:signal transduction histidine kinase
LSSRWYRPNDDHWPAHQPDPHRQWGAIVLVGLIYLLTLTRRYHLVMNTTMLLGTSIVVFNATWQQTSQYEIAFLVVLPLVSSMLFSLPVTLLWIVFNFLVMLAFRWLSVMPARNRCIWRHLEHYIVISLFILFVGYQRNRLEQDRRQMAVKGERASLFRYVLASISHDFRTPLTIINTRAYLLRPTLTEPKQVERLDTIVEQGDRLTNMVEDILELAELEFDEEKTMEPVDLAAVVRMAVAGFQPMPTKQVLLSAHKLTDGLPRITAHETDLFRLASQLVQNAIQYTSRVSVEVSVRGCDAGQSVCELCADNNTCFVGIGCEPGHGHTHDCCKVYRFHCFLFIELKLR